MENLDYYKRMASQYYRQVGAIDCIERSRSPYALQNDRLIMDGFLEKINRPSKVVGNGHLGQYDSPNFPGSLKFFGNFLAQGISNRTKTREAVLEISQ